MEPTMQTELDKLLCLISPEHTIEETFNRANEAINTFHIESAQIDNWDEYRNCIVELLRHLEARILLLREPVKSSFEFYWSRGAYVLSEVYGSSGVKAAFEMARTGNNGGLYDVIKKVAMHVAEDYAKNNISVRVYDYWNRLSVDEKIEASSEYIAKYGHLLPSELTEGSAARIHADFVKVLKEHPRILQRIRRTGR